MTKPILAFDFQDLNESNHICSHASVGEGKITFHKALFEAAYQGTAPRFQYAFPGHGAMAAGQIASLLCGKAGYTVSMWLMPYQSFHGKHDFRLLTVYGNENKPLLELDYASPRITARIDTGSEAPATVLLFPYALDTLVPAFDAPNTNDGIWQFVTLSVDFAANTVKLYVNGQEIAAKDEPTIEFAYDALPEQLCITLPDCIGGNAQLTARSFSGIIDQWQLFGEALTADAVSELYRSYPKNITPSPTEHQKQLNALVAKLGSSFVLKADSANIVHKGRVIKADTSDYTVRIVWQDEALYLPEDFCEWYFACDGISTVNIKGKNYFPADAICAQNKLQYIASAGNCDLYVLLAQDASYDPAADASLLNAFEVFCTEDKNEPKLPVEQTRRVIATSDTKAGDYTYSPSITRLGDKLYASRDISCLYTEVFESVDDGENWTYQGKVDGMWWATIFEHQGALYLIGRHTIGGVYVGKEPHYIGVTRSTDGGKTWTPINAEQGGIVYDGGLGVHCAPTPVLKHNGRIYRVFETNQGGRNLREFLISADETSDLTNPASWTASDYFTGYGFPNEGNAVIGPDGGVWILARFTNNHAYLMKYDKQLNKVVPFREPMQTSLIDFPSTASKFTVRLDKETGKYIALVSTQMDPNCAYQRNYATLAVSDDLEHWEVKQILLRDREIYNAILSVAQHAFQYIDWIFDGEDILFVVRESAEDAKNWHDSNYLTLYRIENYRALIQ